MKSRYTVFLNQLFYILFNHFSQMIVSHILDLEKGWARSMTPLDTLFVVHIM